MTWLFRYRMIWLLLHSHSLPLSLPSCVSPNKHTGGREGKGKGKGKGEGEEPNHTTSRKPAPLLIIQYTLIFSLHFILSVTHPVQDFALWIRIEDTPDCVTTLIFCGHILLRFIFHLEKPEVLKDIDV
jgi:hypothetical protein